MSHHSNVSARNGYLRPLLWGALAIGVVGNVVFSTTGVNLAANLVFSLVTAAAVVALIVHHYRNRRG